MSTTPAEIEAMFTDAKGAFRFARWGRPIAPIVFGVDDATLNIFRALLKRFRL